MKMLYYQIMLGLMKVLCGVLTTHTEVFKSYRWVSVFTIITGLSTVVLAIIFAVLNYTIGSGE